MRSKVGGGWVGRKESLYSLGMSTMYTCKRRWNEGRYEEHDDGRKKEEEEEEEEGWLNENYDEVKGRKATNVCPRDGVCAGEW